MRSPITNLTTGPTGGGVKFVSPHRKQLVVADLGVAFVDGEAEIGKDTIDALRGLPGELGVRAAGRASAEGLCAVLTPGGRGADRDGSRCPP
ncbi:hypothetical protein ALI22I_13675 [Saccharothrix sp. ALI-22-I]|uniref:hypothetical protein n=1 Tax=Saccharothrix sp. ALI-22-I TaxID=1933778 RepID=UPI00097BB83F|nr:hypothetical protein [Saccharothrix sp. ALI-22-I]ONI89968.1 hypothetical protein ALI22I_13675 [Saccharothrix sp. ALI-22-I]